LNALGGAEERVSVVVATVVFLIIQRLMQLTAPSMHNAL
jgi:hypothetical protein